MIFISDDFMLSSKHHSIRTRSSATAEKQVGGRIIVTVSLVWVNEAGTRVGSNDCMNFSQKTDIGKTSRMPDFNASPVITLLH